MRSLINARQIRALRKVANAALNDRVTLRNPATPTRGTGGGIVKNPTPVDTPNVAGRLEQMGFQTGAVREVADRLQLVNPYTWVFAWNQTNLTDATVVLFGSRTFNVRAVMETGAYRVSKRAICDEV